MTPKAPVLYFLGYFIGTSSMIASNVWIAVAVCFLGAGLGYCLDRIMR